MSSTAKYCLEIIDQLYENVSGYTTSVKSREKLQQADSSLIYGELTSQSLFDLLEVVQPQPGEVFYDLGSGSGKPVLWASILYDWSKCCGIELLPELYDLSVEQSQKLLALPEIKQLLPGRKFNIRFINDDFLNEDVSDANIIVLNATAFSYDLWQSLIGRLSALPKGARLIVLTKSIRTEEFELIHSGMCEVSWGMNSVNIYKKVK